MERIDVHCHAVAPGYRQYALDSGHEQPDGMPCLPAWSPESHIALMKKLNITKSILSITSPGTHLSPDHDAAAMTRQTNAELSAISRAHPSHFRFFASLPLPLVEASMAEIDHALDDLGAVGFAVLSNANGVYLGDAVLDPVFAKLNARKAIVFIHPTTCNVTMTPSTSTSTSTFHAVKPLTNYPRPMMEFMFDETRAIANLLLSGTVARHPHVTFIMSHCGCALPSLVDRIGAFATLLGSGGGESDQSGEFRRLLRERFFFDLAGFPFPNQIHGLLRVLGDGGEGRLMYGTDYPFTPEKVVVDLAAQLDQGCEELFDAEQRGAVYSSNAEKLFGL
ncbi:amidohydrolase [Podospora appendiculata]|uniref:6-methylsalicylate decarboxylase n=1 Tax=Podospora appendiculata TaxID=314037 RepID=A0AAE1CID6_9PEZI|nr:amidohydrolase [Podospora appendiculata]